MVDSTVLPFEKALRPAVVFLVCPVKPSLDVIGRKWSLLVLYSMTFLRLRRFNELLRYNPGLTPRILSKRLAQLEGAGYITKAEERNNPKMTRWEPTEKGKDTIPILIRFIRLSAKWDAATLFPDKTPRTLKEIVPQSSSKKYFE